jgi:hypothetical protein
MPQIGSISSGVKAFLERIEAFDIGLDILLVVELLFTDHVQHRVQHRDVGTVRELHHAPGMTLQRLSARIHHDKLRTAFRRLLEEGGRHGMILGRIGTDHDDDVRILHLIEGRRDRRGADAFQQSCDRGSVAEPRAMVDIVGAEAGPHQLLEQIGFFVRAFRRTEAREPLRALLLLDL